MKKMLFFLLVLCFALTLGTAQAESTDPAADPILIERVENVLDSYELSYEYDAELEMFTFPLDVDNELETLDVTIFLYYDMISVKVESPLQIDESSFDNMAIFTTLVNNDIYYAQFRVDIENGYVSCRSCNVIEEVLPSESEIDVLLYMPVTYMDKYGGGIYALSTGDTNPHKVYELCNQVIE